MSTQQLQSIIVSTLVQSREHVGTADNLLAAALEYIARRDRRTHPAGTFDKRGRFDLADSERCECCKGIRSPSASYPYSEMVHARTAKHVACMYSVDERELKRCVRQYEK